jgi:hypothetical protein
MKSIKNLFFIGLIALVALITFTGCKNSAGSGASVTYSGTAAGGETYTLVIYENGNRAAYTPQNGDRYELTIIPGNSRSVGTVENAAGTTLTLKPSKAEAQSFTVTTSVTEGGSGQITAITGTVTLEDGKTIAGSGIVIPGGDTGNTFVAVTSFRGDSVVVAEVGEPLALNDKYSVYPDNASDKTITWSVKDAGSTGATISANVLTATAMGDATITGTVANGKAVGTPFTADRTVSVKGPMVAHGDFVVRDIPGGVELTQYLGNDAHVVVPGDLGITVLGRFSLRASTIISVVVPEGVTEIDGAFNENYYLTSVTLPQSLVIIRGGSFLICSSMSSITIPSKVTTIGNMAFFNCSALTSMRVEAATPPSVERDLFARDLTPEGLTAIYVPAASVDVYKNADGWKKHADLITAIP